MSSIRLLALLFLLFFIKIVSLLNLRSDFSQFRELCNVAEELSKQYSMRFLTPKAQDSCHSINFSFFVYINIPHNNLNSNIVSVLSKLNHKPRLALKLKKNFDSIESINTHNYGLYLFSLNYYTDIFDEEDKALVFLDLRCYIDFDTVEFLAVRLYPLLASMHAKDSAWLYLIFFKHSTFYKSHPLDYTICNKIFQNFRLTREQVLAHRPFLVTQLVWRIASNLQRKLGIRSILDVDISDSKKGSFNTMTNILEQRFCIATVVMDVSPEYKHYNIQEQSYWIDYENNLEGVVALVLESFNCIAIYSINLDKLMAKWGVCKDKGKKTFYLKKSDKEKKRRKDGEPTTWFSFLEKPSFESFYRLLQKL